MSTNEGNQPAELGEASSPKFGSAPPDWLNPERLAQLANEFFTALPSGGPSDLNAGTIKRLPSVPGYFADIAKNPPTATASSVPLAIEPDLSPFASVAHLPGDPGAASYFPALPANLNIADELIRAASSPVSSYSFLDDARPLFSATPVSPPHISLPSSRLGPAASTLPQNDGTIPADALGLFPKDEGSGAPSVAGAPSRPEAPERGALYAFLDEGRQLSPFEVVLPSQPLGSQPLPVPDLNLSSRSFEVNEIRRDFPILNERINGRPLIWLDNAATTQKPQAVITRLSDFYAHENSNVHRAAHELAARATDAYEAAREKVRRFLHAPSVQEIVFVRGATEGINLVAQSWGRQNVRQDDEIVITWLEHHANIVPWQMLCAEKGARLRVAPVDDTGQILLEEYAKLLGPRTRLVSLPQVSNALGTVTPAKEMIEIAHRHGAVVLLDGAQAVSHLPVDVQWLDCDFYVFSGHKVFAPTGIGAVYGKLGILSHTQPWQGGGSMIKDVTFEKTVYQAPPARFEAGTGNIADAAGLGAALDYIERIGLTTIARYEHDLLAYGTERLLSVPGLRLIGTAKEKAGVLSFVIDGLRTEDIGAALNREGIAVRAGHHCAQPIHRRFNLQNTVRVSLALYNTCDEIDALVAALWNLKQGHTSGI